MLELSVKFFGSDNCEKAGTNNRKSLSSSFTKVK
jgi:hypothetical protein